MALPRQVDHAVKFYAARSYDYDSTWHADFAKRFFDYISDHLKPGSQVLDLACGTGLLTFLEADAVGPTGHVMGFDVTPSMLEVAKHKKLRDGEKYANVDFYLGDVLNLGDIGAMEGKLFDVITVASALVLFPDPKAAIEHWTQFLKPGGMIAMDSTHPQNLISGMVLERTARRLELEVPYNREWSKSEESLEEVLQSAGLQVEQVVTVENQAGYDKRYHGVEEWDDHFVENVIMKDVVQTFTNNDIRRKAQGVFKEEWEKLGESGKVEEIDAVFLGIARKPADGSRYVPKGKDELIFRGGCRCGAVSYTSTAPPSEITNCHCRACQQVSGSDYLPFIDVPKTALKFAPTTKRKSLRLSNIAERTFCSSCGTPISMESSQRDTVTSLTMGSVDIASLKCDIPIVGEHIFLSEKVPWLQLPADGAKRVQTCQGVEFIKPFEKAETS